VNAPLAQRQLVLAAAALLAVLAALAVTRLVEEEREGSSGAPASAAEWRRARAAPYSFPAGARRTACGLAAGPRTLGLAHPVLPCGAKIVIRFDGQEVLTQVVDRGAGASGREFDVTRPLARRIGLSDTQPIEWRFAERPAE
jgi:rare lipoprotein A (peptidoglycan hydrolase)